MTTTTPRPPAERVESGHLATERRRGGFSPMLAALLAILAVVVIGGVWMLAAGDESISEATAVEELVAQERAAMEPYFGESDPATYVAMIADEFTYFDPNSGGRLVDEAAREYLSGFAGSIPPLDYEILNPQVQMFGDTAVFTFQMDVIDPESGAVVGQWMTTEIHERVGEDWEMVHAHWSNPAPPAEPAE